MKYIYFGGGIIILIIAFLLWKHPKEPVSGQLYSRAGHDSTIVARAVVSDSAASPLARRLVTDLLTRDLRVKIEKTGPCKAVMDYYDKVNLRLQATKDLLEQAFLAARPVQLFSDDGDQCFSYSITYHIPLLQPMNWRNHVITKVPLQLTIIHPLTDFKYFRHEQDH